MDPSESHPTTFRRESQDDTMTGLDHTDSPTQQYSAVRQGSSQSGEYPPSQAATYSPNPEHEANNRYPTPPTAFPPPISRPSSGLSGTSHANMAASNYAEQQSSRQSAASAKSSVVIKVGMVGDAQIGKTSLMVKYVEGSWDEDYIQTLGVNFMEKTISIRNTEITFSIWDLGGQREFVNMLPLVCNDAVAILFMFDLTRKSTLNSIKEWYRQGRGFNKTAIPFLVGTKYDTFVNFPSQEQEEISNQVGLCSTGLVS